MLKWLFGESVPSIAPKDAATRQRDGALIIDVRESSEWAGGHIAGATHIPLGSLGKKVNSLARDRDIIVVCQSGMRSGTAAKQLRAAGFENVLNLSGGMISWRIHGLPVTR